MKKVLFILAVTGGMLACNTAENNNHVDSAADKMVDSVKYQANEKVDSVRAATNATVDSAKAVADAMKDSIAAVGRP